MPLNSPETENIISIKYIINLIKRKWLLISSITIIFVLYASYNAFFKKDIYEVKFCVSPFNADINDHMAPLIESSTLEIIINNFSLKYDQLKSDLAKGKTLPNTINLKNFNKISVAPSISESGDKKNRSVDVSLFVYDTMATKAIINDLLFYINQNSHIKSQFAEKKKLLNSKKIILENGLNQMIITRNNLSSVNSQINIFNSNIHKDIIDAQKELDIVSYQLNNLSAVKIIADAENPNKPKGVPPLKGFIIISLLGIFFSLCFAIILDKLNVKST